MSCAGSGREAAAVLLALASLAPARPAVATDDDVRTARVVTAGLPQGTELVLLLHGLARGPGSMQAMRRHLAREGYHSVCWPYDSTRHRVERHGTELLAELRRLDDVEAVTRVHLVGHSLGGIVIRQALGQGAQAKIGRVVLVASPNQGSRRARRTGWLRSVLKPIGQLSDVEGSFVRSLPEIRGVEIGVIAGARDSTVRVEETRLDGATDHLVVASGHTRICARKPVHEAVTTFLRTGAFPGQAAQHAMDE